MLVVKDDDYKRLRRIWNGMKSRCMNPNCISWDNYGGRGIFICKEWRINFDSFLEWALTHGYADGLSIDRIDNDDGYYPDNCRWATAKEQSTNRRPPKKQQPKKKYYEIIDLVFDCGRLFEEMNRLGITRKGLSELTGIRYNTLVLKLVGKAPIDIDEAKRIKQAIGSELTIEELFFD